MYLILKYMLKYNCTTYIILIYGDLITMENLVFVNRKGTNCYKWDPAQPPYGLVDFIPLTVADLDYKCPNCVRSALKNYIEMGALGYGGPSDTYFSNFISWEKQYHNISIKREWLRFAPGVLVAIAWLLEELFHPNDTCLIFTPVYEPFHNISQKCGLNLITSELINQNGYYSIDFSDFEEKIIQHKVKVLLFCSPHNPIGRVWTKEELTQLISICKKHNVFIISDEIHHDITLFGHVHLSLLSFTDYQHNIAMLTSPAKTFNLAGLENSFMVLPNEKIRDKIDKRQDRVGITSGNILGNLATETAYAGGREWLENFFKIIEKNYLFAKKLLLEAFPNLEISPLEGTFLMWVNFKNYINSDFPIREYIAKKCGVLISDGFGYGGSQFATYARINLATSEDLLKTALYQIINGLSSHDC